MKRFLTISLLILLFLGLSLSFCVMELSVNENPYAPAFSVRYASDGDRPGRLHLSLSEGLLQRTKGVLGAVRTTSEALPFFITDGVLLLKEEAVSVLSLLSAVINTAEHTESLL